jgi:DNA repair exonuclease SbcCD ATPase subunit
MIGYQIGVTHYENFGPFEDVEFDFSAPGLTVIEGHIEGKRGCDSNGAGKSFLFDGVAWCLYGRCIRGAYKGDEVIRLGSKGGCSVTVTIVGDKEIKVRRTRKHTVHGNSVDIWVDGEAVSRGTATMSSNAIESIIGMDFMSFCNSVAFGARDDVRSFFAASDSDRKSVMERLLGLERFTQAEKIAKKRLMAVQADIDAVSSDRATLTARLQEKEAALDELVYTSDPEAAEIELLRARLRVKLLAKKVDIAEEVVSEAEAELKPLEVEYDKVTTLYENTLTDYQSTKKKLQKALTEVEKDMAVNQHEAKRLDAKHAGYSKSVGSVCPECEQKITKAHAKKLKDAVIEERVAIDRALAKLSKKKQARETELDELEPPKTPVPPDELYAAREALEDAQEILAGLANKLEVETVRTEEMAKAHDTLASQEAALRKQIEKTAAALQELDDGYVAKEAEAARLRFWIEGFGNQGIKSFMIEAEIPAINKLASGYAQLLLGDGAVVRLSATSKLKSKDAVREKLSVEGAIPGCTKTYAGASKGQKKRMDLSILLAFSDLVASRSGKPIQQLLADELFDGLDRTGVESVSELLRELSAGCPVALITHDPKLKPIADRVVVVHHVDGKAAVDVPGTPPPKAKKKAVKKQAPKMKASKLKRPRVSRVTRKKA